MNEGGAAWCKAEVIAEAPGVGALRQTVEGTPVSVAAWLRAVASELDPPKPIMRRAGRTRSLGGGDKRGYNQE